MSPVCVGDRGMGLHDSNPSTSSTCLRGSSIWGGFHQAHEHFFTLYLLYYPWGGPMVTLVHVHTVAPAYIWSLFHSREFHQAILQSKRVLTWKFCAQWMQILSSKWWFLTSDWDILLCYIQGKLFISQGSGCHFKNTVPQCFTALALLAMNKPINAFPDTTKLHVIKQ